MQNKKIIRLAIAAMLTALSVVSLYAIRLPLIPSAPFLEYDAADIPVLIGSMLLGPGMGLLMLLAVCAIQAFTVSAASGWIGFVMHLAASGVLVLIASMIYKKKPSFKRLIVGLVLGSLAMTAVMVPLNIVFTGIFLGQGAKAVAELLIPAIIPFNLLRPASIPRQRSRYSPRRQRYSKDTPTGCNYSSSRRKRHKLLL